MKLLQEKECLLFILPARILILLVLQKKLLS